MSQHILIVEDEADIVELLTFILEKAGYSTSAVNNGSDAVSAVKERRPDLILLDLMLPGKSGLEVCDALKASSALKAIPIIMLTAKSEESDIVKGLELGADDYIPKPFSPKILTARIQAVLRRQGAAPVPSDQRELLFGPLRIIPASREVHVNDTNIPLTYSEFQALYELARRDGRVFTRYQIVEAVHGEDHDVTDRTIDVLMVGLRKKLGEAAPLIETIRGVGYRFKAPIE